MSAFGSSIPNGGSYGQALMKFGECQERIAQFQIDYVLLLIIFNSSDDFH